MQPTNKASLEDLNARVGADLLLAAAEKSHRIAHLEFQEAAFAYEQSDEATSIARDQKTRAECRLIQAEADLKDLRRDSMHLGYTDEELNRLNTARSGLIRIRSEREKRRKGVIEGA